MPRRKFTESEAREAIWENEVDLIKGEDRRWTRTNTTIVKMKDDGKYYELHWEQGLTERQENMYEDQNAREVKKIERTVIKTESYWVGINEDDKEQNEALDVKSKYLGDSVYAEDKGPTVLLYTDNGDGQKNRIFMESSVLVSFINFINKRK